jgi:dethiobiotin synthetase
MARYFVTSSGTELGKTLVSAALCHQARARGLKVTAIKPVMSGFDPARPEESDAGILLASQGRAAIAPELDAIAPWRFAPALSPDRAAAREGRAIPFDELVAFCTASLSAEADFALVEGAGGVMAPIGAKHLVLDWMEALDLPPLLVVGSYLGTISHTLTAVTTLSGRGLEPAAIVISESSVSPMPVAETADAIRRFAPGIPIHIVPRLSGSEPWRVAPDLSDLL